MSLTLSAPSPTVVAPATTMCCGSQMEDKESFVTQTVYQVCTKCHKNNYSQRSYEGRVSR